jgi:hypothetical protein
VERHAKHERKSKLDLFPVKIPFYREDRDTAVPVTQCNELCIVTQVERHAAALAALEKSRCKQSYLAD